MSRIKIKLLRVPSLNDPKVNLVEKGETFVIEDSGVLCYKHHITGEIFNPLTGTPIWLNPRFITADFTVPAGHNGASVGPISISDGVTVTIQDHATWSIH